MSEAGLLTCCRCIAPATQNRWLKRVYGNSTLPEPICDACWAKHKEETVETIGNYLENHSWKADTDIYYWLDLLYHESEETRHSRETNK